MSLNPTYYLPAGTNSLAFSTEVVAWPSGLLLPVWPTLNAYNFSSSIFSGVVGAANDKPIPSPLGYKYAAADGSYGAWLATSGKAVGYITASGLTQIVQNSVGLSQSVGIVGIAVTGNTSSGNTLVGVGSDGSVFISNLALAGSASFITPGFGAQARGAVSGYGNLYTALPASGALGVMALGSRAFSTIPTPTSLSTPSIVSVPLTGIVSGNIAVAGWALSSVASGAVAFSASPVSPSTLAVFAESTMVNLLYGNDPLWGVVSSVTGLSGCNALTWNPDGSQIFASLASGVAIIDLTSDTISVASTISLTGATEISVTPDSTNALVCRPSANAITVLIGALDSWTLGSSTSIPSPVATLITSTTSGWALSASNLIPLTRVGNVWTAGTAIPLGFPGKSIQEDAITGNVIIVGGSGTSGYIALLQSGVITSTLTYSGAYGTSLLLQNGQAAVLLSDGQTILMFGVIGSLLVSQGTNSLALPTGTTVMAATEMSVWLANSLEILECNWAQPYQIAQRKSGSFGIHNGATWYTYNLGCGEDPTALAWDVSGNVWMATAQNTLYKFNGTAVSGNVSLLAQYSIPTYSGQPSGTTLGISSLVWNNNHLYASTLFPGALVEIM